MRRASKYDYLAYQSTNPLVKEKQGLVLKGKFGKFDATALFKSLKADDIRAGLNSRIVHTHGSKKVLQERLTDYREGQGDYQLCCLDPNNIHLMH